MHIPSAQAQRLAGVLERFVRSLRSFTHTDPLSLTAAGVLGRLADAGPSSVTLLARAEAVSQPAMTQLVSRLHAEGLVARAPSEQDRRSVVVSITDAGRQAITARRALRTGRVAEAIEQLSGDERAQLLAALPALEHLAEVSQRIPADAGDPANPTEPAASSKPANSTDTADPTAATPHDHN